VYLAMNLTNSSYSYFKSILQANNEFLVVFESANGTVIPFQNYCAIGNYTGIIDADYTSGVYCHPANFTSVTYTDLVRINRYAVYNSEIVRMVIYSWS
jgi:dUTPase